METTPTPTPPTPSSETPSSPPAATPSTPAAAPAAEPAAAAPTPQPEEKADAGIQSFLQGADSEEGDEGEEGTAPTPEAPPAAAAAPTPPAPAAAPPAPAVPPTPTAEAQPQPEAVQPTQPTPESQPELSPEQVHQRFKQFRDDAVNLLSEKHYNLSADQVKEIVDPETGMVNGEKLAKVVSRTASQVYMDVVTAAMGQMVQHLPVLIQRVVQGQQQSQATEGKFFEAWPDLKNHRDVVIRIGTTFRQQNPRATLEQFIQEVGASAMIALRKTPGAPAGQPTPAAPAPVRPFRPAAASRPTAVPPTTKPLNPFEALAAADADEDTTVEEVQ